MTIKLLNTPGKPQRLHGTELRRAGRVFGRVEPPADRFGRQKKRGPRGPLFLLAYYLVCIL
ncbi:hypothetical protein AB4142_30035, partial [Variovorax sp. 2RAF20]